jgi:hypothetical protein
MYSQALDFFSFKIAVVRELKQTDYAAKFVCATGYCKTYTMDSRINGWFHVNGHVNKQNVRIWNNETSKLYNKCHYTLKKQGFGVL